MTTRVILVRHGQSTYNAQKRIQGRLDDSVLTDQGRVDASCVAQALQGLRFDAIYHSPLQRAQQTAQLIRSRVGAAPALQPTDLLMEIDLPLWAGLPRQEVRDRFPQDYQCWQQSPHEFFMVLESGHKHFPVLALFEQAQQFWRHILSHHPNQTILVVAHNGINRSLIATALGVQPQFYQSIQQSNCGISIINIGDVTPGELPQPAAVQLESMNLTSHVGDKLPSLRPEHRGPRLLLVRHGETEWNRKGQFQGQIDIPLNDNGRLQARQAADFLQDIKIDFAITSPMARPRETAEIILEYHRDIELQFEDNFREISHGLWEGKFESEIEHDYPGLLNQWKTAPETVQMPEGENLNQVGERVAKGWENIINKYDSQSVTGLVVAHDAVNKALLCQLLGLSPEHFWNFKQGNGSVTVIDYPHGAKGEPVLQTMNITTHLSGSILDKTAAGAL
ncbi:MAG: histidine phosphatase family protein [Arthrospira sp. SH-MAG29]|nr:histidine phosphatase family protein [Arthrospira sp. SH-MAG29]MBS0014966.1 histidine phosphatase family protein [Arthrospira sp. SH-MAG29]